MKILGREPALWIAIITSAVLLIGTLGLHWLSGEQAGLVVAAISAIGGAVTAYFVRPVAPAAFVAAVSAIVALASAYGLNLNPDTVAALNSLVITVLALLTRGQVSPVATALTHASVDPTPEASAAASPAGDAA